MKIPRVILTLVTAAVITTGIGAAAARPAQEAEARPGALSEALETFQRRVREYQELRDKVRKTIPALASTESAAELAARRTAQVTAVRAARSRARQGEFFTPTLSAVVRVRVRADLAQRGREARALFHEVPDVARPSIGMSYPAEGAHSTIPALLLLMLPELPGELQYRFLGRHLVLLDGDLQMVLDYVSNVVPRP